MLKSILIATDMSKRSDRALHRAVRIARAHEAKLTVLTVLDDALPELLMDDLHDKTRAMLERFVASRADGVDTTITVLVGDPTGDILRAAQGDYDLLVMGVHRPRPFLDALRETTMQRVVRRSDCPVLLVADRSDDDYKSVLAASDFSPAATAALILANRLAPEARITPVHALHVPYAGMLAPTDDSRGALVRSFRKEVAEQAELWLTEEGLPRDRMNEVDIVQGSPYAVLHGLVQRDRADLIAVGAHGRVGAARSILGSVASDLIRNPPCDVLIARTC